MNANCFGGRPIDQAKPTTSFLFQFHPRMPNSFAGMRVRSAAAAAVQMQLPHECLYVSPHSVQINRIDIQEDARPTALS